MCSCIARVKRKKPSQGGRLHKNRVNCQSQVQEISALPSSPRFSGPIGWFGWPLKHISNLQGRPWYQIRKEMACPWPATCRLWAGSDLSPESAPRAHGRAAAFCHGSALRIVGGRRIISSAQQVGMEKGGEWEDAWEQSPKAVMDWGCHQRCCYEQIIASSRLWRLCCGRQPWEMLAGDGMYLEEKTACARHAGSHLA